MAAARLDGHGGCDEALKAQGPGGAGGPGSGAARPHPGGDSRPAGDRSGGAGAGGAPAEHGAGPTEGGGDPAAPGCGREESLSRELERREGEYQAISAALEGLKAANAQLQERFSPELNRRAADYLRPPHRRAVPGAVPWTGSWTPLPRKEAGCCPGAPCSCPRGRWIRSIWRCVWRCTTCA